MNHNQFEHTLRTSTLNGDGSPVSHQFAVNLAIDTTWAVAASPAPQALTTGELCTNVVTFATKALTAEGDFLLFTDAAGLEWAWAADVDGGGITNAGPRWAAIPAARKAISDISAVVGADAVAALAVAALNVLAGFSFTLTDNADGTVDFVANARGPLPAFESFVADESGAGSTTFVETVAGEPSAFSITANTVSKVGHGYQTGQCVRVVISAGALPTPLLAATDYFVIRVDADTFKLATSMANALAGSEIDFTDAGTVSETVTAIMQANVGSLIIEYTTDRGVTPSSTWIALETIDLVGGSSPVKTRVPVNYYDNLRARLTMTKGALSNVKVVSFGKELKG